MQKEKSPAFQFYPKDFLADANVAMMTMEQRGIYITLLSYCWIEGSIPIEIDKLARLCGADALWFKKIWDPICTCFEVKNGRYVQKRLIRELNKQKKYSESRSQNAKSRWDKVKSELSTGMHMHSTCDALHLQFPFASSDIDSRNQEDQKEIFKTPPKTILRIFKILKPKYIFNHPEHKQYVRIFYELTQFDEADITREYEMIRFREVNEHEKAPAYYLKSVWGRLNEVHHERMKAAPANEKLNELIQVVLSSSEHALHG